MFPFYTWCGFFYFYFFTFYLLHTGFDTLDNHIVGIVTIIVYYVVCITYTLISTGIRRKHWPLSPRSLDSQSGNGSNTIPT